MCLPGWEGAVSRATCWHFPSHGAQSRFSHPFAPPIPWRQTAATKWQSQAVAPNLTSFDHLFNIKLDPVAPVSNVRVVVEPPRERPRETRVGAV